MTELKTLKDFTTKGLEFREKRTSDKLIEDIKIEAIKWVKSFSRTGEDFLTVGGYSASTWIIMFFNLTEEDLK